MQYIDIAELNYLINYSAVNYQLKCIHSQVVAFFLPVLSNETVADIIQCGFTDVFPSLSIDEEVKHEHTDEGKSDTVNQAKADGKISTENQVLYTEGMGVKNEEGQLVTESDVMDETDEEDDHFDNEQDDKEEENDLYGSDDTDVVDEAIFALTKDVANDLAGRFSDVRDEESTVEPDRNYHSKKDILFY